MLRNAYLLGKTGMVKCEMSSQNKFWERKAGVEASHGQSSKRSAGVVARCRQPWTPTPRTGVQGCALARLHKCDILSAFFTNKQLGNGFLEKSGGGTAASLFKCFNSGGHPTCYDTSGIPFRETKRILYDFSVVQ